MKKMYDDNLIRADRAETLARLQEQVAYERARVEQEKLRLEKQISRLFKCMREL